MIEWLGYAVPWWLWIGVGFAVAAVAYFKLGPKVSLLLLAAIGVFLVDRRGRQAGWAEREDKQNRQDRAFIDEYRETQHEAVARSDDELDDRNARWLHKP